MELIDKTSVEICVKENKESLGLINRLISSSFGVFFRGDYEWQNLPKDYYFPSLARSDRLGVIGRSFFIGATYVGRFNSQTGDDLTVGLKYKNSAIKYAELYERTFGKKVRVVIVDR